MRVAYFSDNFYPEISGISDSIITTGEELKKRGHEVLYVAPFYPPSAYKKTRSASRDALNTLRLPSLPMPGSPTGQSRIALPFGASFAQLEKFKPDIIHTQSPYGTGLEAMRAAKRLKVPLVGTNHTPLEEFIHYAPGGKLYLGPALKFEAWYYNHCRFITAPYQGLIEEMRSQGLTAPGRAQANPVPLTVSPKTPEERNACKVDMNIPGPMVLSSGRLAPEKHVDEVIAAFAEVLKKVPNATLVVTGHGSAEDALKKQAARLGVGERVRFVGFVTPDKLGELYCTADVYVVMSTAETQSLSLMQGYASGVPAIVARSRGLIDYCPPECGVRVEPGQREALASAIEKMLTDESARARMGAAALEFVKKFSPPKIAEDWEQIYSDCIKRG